MSLFQLNRCVYDWIRAGEVNSGPAADGRAIFDTSGYELTEDERKAFDSKDVASLYRLGVHEVLVNRFARAAGFGRDDYRKLLEPFGEKEERKGRWQK